jgi:ubiquitin carboxyl-terminal hydrolase 48
MLFSNPLKRNMHVARTRQMRFAVPPGMENLGATCYLNTQLQCLARNTAFLDGIFDWKPSNSESRMDSVLSKLQHVLAGLAYGAASTSTTEEFAHALGLQNDEMQDPNEFARLLFQRMHEAFQQSSKQSLSTLLPTIFEGDMTYETQCQSCSQATERSEKFMDINLPIVHAATAAKKSKGGQLQIDEAFAASSAKDKDTSVQFCLDSYMFPEELAGENQYWCEKCGEKRDATRQVVFSKLPPVLNIQLCRYVYDRKKQTKKKLNNKVMLPQRLDVKSKNQPEPTSYRLCAVMKHLGTSAYRGHYIAEAMDWQTGTWFEFNDEKVKILNEGPSCSSGADYDDKPSKKPKNKGSPDAYNMYYVSEDFLGKCAMSSTVKVQDKGSVIQHIEAERKARYDVLAE